MKSGGTLLLVFAAFPCAFSSVLAGCADEIIDTGGGTATCVNVSVGNTCSVEADLGYTCTGDVICDASLLYNTSVQCHKSCPESQFGLWANDLVVVHCDRRMVHGETCSLTYNKDIIACSGEVKCSDEVYSKQEAHCQCANSCNASLCGDQICIPLTVFPEAAGLVESTACPLPEVYTCGCNPCNGHSCALYEHCKEVLRDTCVPNECCQEPQCTPMCVPGSCPLSEGSCTVAQCFEGVCVQTEAPNGTTCMADDGIDGECSWGLCKVDTPFDGNCSCTSTDEQCALSKCSSSDCAVVVRTGWSCHLNSSSPATSVTAMGACALDGTCVGVPLFIDDCHTVVCDHDETCFDADRVVNNQYECRCPAGMLKENGACTMQDVCTPNEVATCEREYKDCSVQGCVQRSCEDLGSLRQRLCAALPASCSFVDDPATGYDGCPHNPCAYTCLSACSAEGNSRCWVQARRMASAGLKGESVALLTCVAEAADRSESCVAVPCPTPRCPRPAPGCDFVPVVDADGIVKRDETGCPAFPCGKERCVSECSVARRAQCASLEPRMDCIVTVSTTAGSFEATCVPFRCPLVVCSNPVSGCRYRPDSAALADATGCPLFPCGYLDCSESETCSVEAESNCSALGKSCVPSQNGTGACVSRACQSRKWPCTTSIGCHFDDESESSDWFDDCPTRPCGVEVCTPLPLCETLDCDVCRVLNGVPVCATSKEDVTCSRFCKPKVCLQSVIGPICIESTQTNCDGKACPSNTYCHEPEDGLEVQCASIDASNCDEACNTTGECQPVFSASEKEPTWQCVDRSDTPCDLDECACAGMPCAAYEVCGVTPNGTFSCAFRDRQSDDVCARIVCPDGPTGNSKFAFVACAVRHGQPECILEIPWRKCSGCDSTEICDYHNAKCIAPECSDCKEGETCVFTDGKNACSQGADPCTAWAWLPQTCHTDSDCSSGDVCPHAPSWSLAGAVSAWCSCAYSAPQICTESILPDAKYCVPRQWDCNSPVQSDVHRNWCCSTMQLHCVDTDELPVYSCSVDRLSSRGPETWPIVRKEYCCSIRHPNICALLAGNVEYDCSSKEVWTTTKTNWCCNQVGVNCPPEPFQCGGSDVQTWPDDQLVYCCRTRGEGCRYLLARNLTAPWTCSPSEKEWSPEQKKFCCERYGMECERNKPRYPCAIEPSAPRVTEWVFDKRLYCCAEAGIGCLNDEDDRPEGPYRCDGDIFSLSPGSIRRAWCCLYREIGCLKDQLLGCQAEQATAASYSPEQKEACCLQTGLHCAYRCTTEASLPMTQEQQAFCCRVKGTGCANKVYASNMSTAKSNGWAGPDLPSSFYVINVFPWVQYIIIPMPWRNVVANPREFTARFLTTIAVSILADPDYPGDPDDLDDLVFSLTVLMIFPVSRDVKSPSTKAISEAIVLKDPWRGSDTLSNRLRQVKKVRELLPSNVSDSLVPTKLQALRQANISDNIAVVFNIQSTVTEYTFGDYSAELVYSRSELYMRNNEGYTYIRSKLTGVTTSLDGGNVYAQANPPILYTITPSYSPSSAESATKWILLGSGAGLVAAGLIFCAVYKWRAAKRCAHQSPLLGAAGEENGPDFELNSYASKDSQEEKSRIVVEEGEL